MTARLGRTINSGGHLIVADTLYWKSTMMTPRRVSRKLREMLGAEACQSSIDWLEMTWMIGFWLASFVGIVGAMLALARIIR